MLVEILNILYWFLPIVILFFSSLNKNPRLFIIGFLVSYFLSYSISQTLLLLTIAPLDASHSFIVNAIEKNRTLVIMNGLFRESFVIALYHIFLGALFWNFLPKKPVIKLREFVEKIDFYIIFLTISLLDLTLSFLRNISFFIWDANPLIIFIFPIFALKALKIDLRNVTLWLLILLFSFNIFLNF
jgi:hypothetical protein